MLEPEAPATGIMTAKPRRAAARETKPPPPPKYHSRGGRRSFGARTSKSGATASWLSLRAALRIEGGEDTGDALYRRLIIHRRLVQTVGMFAIFATSMFGMWRNLNISVLY